MCVVSLNSWSVSVTLYYVSVSGHSLSGELHSLRMSVHSLSVSVSVLLEYRRLSKFMCCQERLQGRSQSPDFGGGELI